MENFISIVGRTNVGKSLLFNKLTKSRKSLVLDHDGLTRDINIGSMKLGNGIIHVQDTGGIPLVEDKINNMVAEKSYSSVHISKIILFVVSASDGLLNQDYDICKKLQKLRCKIILIVNKCDITKKEYNINDFYKLGINEVFHISAKDNTGLSELQQRLSDIAENESSQNIFRRISIIGKPNAGKSTLINTILKDSRMITSDIAGTTIDSIEVPFIYKENQFLLYDTAGIIRKSKAISLVQKYSISATLKTIKTTDICVFILDAEQGITKQDKNILNLIQDSNKAFLIVVNKIDKLSKPLLLELKRELHYFSNITDNAEIIYISALKNQNIKKFLKTICDISYSVFKRYKSSDLTKILEQAVSEHPPPMIKNKRIKLKFVQQSKTDSLKLIIYGNQTDKLPLTYEKYLKNYFIHKLQLVGIPIKIKLSKEKNPFK